MAIATHTSQAGYAPPAGTAPAAASTPGATLVDGALRGLELARTFIESGSDALPTLRSAMRQIRRLPATLAPRGDAMTEGLADLSGYMCRRLGAVEDASGLTTLDDICELLREIRCAWVTMPAAGPTLEVGTGDSHVRRR
jgi:flagellin-specific chaperone FliS